MDEYMHSRTIQSAWRRYRAAGCIAAMRDVKLSGTCTLEYGLLTCLGGLCMVRRRVPISYTYGKMAEIIRSAVHADGIRAKMVLRANHMCIDGSMDFRTSVPMLKPSSVIRLTTTDGNHVLVLHRCSPVWRLRIDNGMVVTVHSEPRPTIDETMSALLRQLRRMGIDMLPSARMPCLLSEDGLRTPVHSCAAFSHRIVNMENRYVLTGDPMLVSRVHPDTGEDVRNVFLMVHNPSCTKHYPDNIGFDMV